MENKLLEKLKTELSEFRDWLLNLEKEEILNHCWEYTAKQDIVATFEATDFPADITEALCNSEYPLTEIYEDYLKLNQNMDDILACITDTGKKLLKRRQYETESKNYNY